MRTLSRSAARFLDVAGALRRVSRALERAQIHDVEAQHPDEFAEYLFDLDPAVVIAAAQRQRSQLKSPAMDVDRFLDNLLRQGLVQTVKSHRLHSTGIWICAIVPRDETSSA